MTAAGVRWRMMAVTLVTALAGACAPAAKMDTMAAPAGPPAAISRAAAGSFLALEVNTADGPRTVGSAVVVGPSLAVTNRHVLSVAAGRPLQAVRPDGTRVAATEAMRSAVADLAVLNVATDGLSPLAPGGAEPGMWAIGAADGRTHVVPAALLRPTARLATFGQGFVVRMDHAARGFSGGPTLDRHGRLAGLTTAGCAIRTPEDAPAIARLAAGLPGPAPSCLRNVFVLDAATVFSELARYRDRPVVPEPHHASRAGA